MCRRLLSMVCCLALLCLPAGRRARADEGWTLPEGVRAAVLVDGAGASMLCGANEGEALSVAGLSKLPALLTLAQAFDEGMIREDAAMHVSSRAAGVTGPTAFLERGEEMPADELMKAAVMISAGDAILTLGEGAYGSESVFVDNINATLRLAGVERTVTDALGTSLTLTAAELALLGRAAAQSETFQRYCALQLDQLRHADGEETELVNANRMVRTYAGCFGLLTGSSSQDGYCGVFAATRSGMTLIAVVLGAQNTATRFSAASSLLDYGFAAYRAEPLLSAGEVVLSGVPVEDGTVRQVDLVAREAVTLLLPRAQERPSLAEEAPELLSAPLSRQTAVAEARFVNAAGETVARVPLYPAEDVPLFRLTDIFRAIFRDFLGMPPDG